MNSIITTETSLRVFGNPQVRMFFRYYLPFPYNDYDGLNETVFLTHTNQKMTLQGLDSSSEFQQTIHLVIIIHF